MSRFDSIGMFWEDVPVINGKRINTRPMPPIPETGWRPPTYFPNLAAASVLSIDTEAKDLELVSHGPGWARGKSHLVGASVGTNDGHRWYFPIRHEVEPEYNLPAENVLAWLRDTLGNPRQPKVGANLIYDVGTLACEGIAVKGELVDVQYAEALLDERAKVNLEALGQKYLGEGKTSNLLYDWCARYYGGKANGSQRANIWRSPPRLVGPYAESDATLPIRLAPILYQLMKAEGLLDLFKMECSSIPLLVKMRMAGVTVNVQKAELIREQLIFQVAGWQARLNNLVGFGVDVNASASIAKAFDKLGFPYERTAKNRPSFTKDFLELCKNPVADAINEIRKLEKLRGTFIESYILESHIKGKIYCQFHPMRQDEGGTRSGRYSSSTPDLQNIPVRDKVWGPELRGLFIPDEGHVAWRKYDYSQIEYRGLIHYAVGPGSDEARANFNANPDTDYHDWALDLVASKAGWDISTDELRAHWRRPVKKLSFGLIFGMGEEHMAESLFMTLPEATKLFRVYHKGVPFAKPTMAATSDEAQRLGYITTILGRRSRFDLWEPSRWRGDRKDAPPPLPYALAIRVYEGIKRAYTYRALNRRLQGTAAEILKASTLKCWQDGIFDVTGVPRLTVHDELDFSDPGGVDEAFREMKHIMETTIRLSIPIRADGDIGPDWGHVSAIG